MGSASVRPAVSRNHIERLCVGGRSVKSGGTGRQNLAIHRCWAPGCTKPAKRKWCSEKCRKKTEYSGTCIVCGIETNGSAGPGRAADRCSKCVKRETEWDEGSIIQALLHWQTNNGRQPVSADWRHAGAYYPSLSTVQRIFGSWSAAIKAVADQGHAGFSPLSQSSRPKPQGSKPREKQQKRPTKLAPAYIPNPIQPLLPRNGDDDDHSTNTPEQNRKMIARMRAERLRRK